MRHALHASLLVLLASSLFACSGTDDPGVGSGGHNPGSPSTGGGSSDNGGASGGRKDTGGGTTSGSGGGSSSGSGSGGSGFGSGGSGGSSTGQSGPVRVQNVSYTRPSANHVQVTFSVANTGSTAEIEQVDLMNVAIGGGGIDFRFDACPSTTPAYAWRLLPGEKSGIFTVDLFAANGSQVQYPCAYANERASASSAASWPSLSGPVTLTFKGLLDDATPWVAVGQGNER